MANAELLEKWKDRRCHACKGPGHLQRYELVPDLDIAHQFPDKLVDFHDTCIGGWLMKHLGCAVQFHQGEV
jgi:hypothetical protein